MNPVEAFLEARGQRKTAASPFLRQVGQHLPEQALLGAATAGTAAAIAGVGVGAHALYHAITKGRDFRQMLSFNEDLRAAHKENPKYINAAFSTLRRMNPEFSRDPMVAGAFVRQMHATPEAAFGLAGQAAGFAPRPGPIQEAALGGLGVGIAPSASMGRQGENKRTESILRLASEPRDRSTKHNRRLQPENLEQVLGRIKTEPLR